LIENETINATNTTPRRPTPRRPPSSSSMTSPSTYADAQGNDYNMFDTVTTPQQMRRSTSSLSDPGGSYRDSILSPIPSPQWQPNPAQWLQQVDNTIANTPLYNTMDPDFMTNYRHQHGLMGHPVQPQAPYVTNIIPVPKPTGKEELPTIQRPTRRPH
jgi:hypothetical protein